MHHPHSQSDARRLRIASLLLLGNRLMILAAAGLLMVSFFANDHYLMIFGSGLVFISLVLLTTQWMAASHAACPLCRTPLLSPIRCIKHRKARRLMGSYQLRVALAIMFTARFRCPFCNKATAMEVGETLIRSRHRESFITTPSRPR